MGNLIMNINAIVDYKNEDYTQNGLSSRRFYIKYKSGIIIQGGLVGTAITSTMAGVSSVSFPIAFSSAVWAAQVSLSYYASTSISAGAKTNYIRGVSLTGLNLGCVFSEAGLGKIDYINRPFSWFAIGM